MTVSVVAFIGRHADKAQARQAVAAQSLGSSRLVGWYDAKPPGEACLEATREAIRRANKGEQVLLVGPRSLVVPLADQGVDPEAWFAAWVSLLAQHSLGFAFAGSSTVVVGPTKASTGRQYQRAEQALHQSIAPNEEPTHAYVCGRPPYGYRVVDGMLAAQPKQQEAVKLAFQMAEKGWALRYIVAALQSDFGKTPDGKPQFWDRVKLKRIWSHVQLYTHGRYQTAGGPVLQLPSLAFMQDAYAEVPYPSPPVRAAAASRADVPSRSGKGKMEAHASSTRRKS